MKKNHYLYGVLALIALYYAIFSSGVVQLIDYKLYDVTSALMYSQEDKKSSSAVVIDIDEKSLEALGQWPWSRLVLVELLTRIKEYHPASIGMDILFAEKDKTSPKQMLSFYKNFFGIKLDIKGLPQKYYDNDTIFAQALKNSQVILPLYLNSYKDNKSCIDNKQIVLSILEGEYLQSSNVMCSIDVLQKNASKTGFINVLKDEDGILRRVQVFRKYNESIIPSFALANLLHVDSLKKETNRVSILNSSFMLGKNSSVLLHLYNDEHYTSISALDVLTQNISLQSIKGKFVIIGASALGLHDRHAIGATRLIPGSFVHTTFIDNILHNDLIYEIEVLKYILGFLSFLLTLYIFKKTLDKKYLLVFLLFHLPCLIVILLTAVLFSQNLYINIGYFIAPIGISFFLISLWFWIFAYFERKTFFENLTKAHSSTIESMALVAETRDTETGAHIKRTKEYIRVLSEYLYAKKIFQNTLTLEYQDLLYRAAPLHDIGKVGVPDMILKKPGKLTEEEFEIMKQHTTIGKSILENAIKENPENKFLKIAHNIAYYHHEKWDGSGYPCGLKEDEIPLEARLMALSDVYDALISRRCYKLEMSFEESEKIIIEGKGKHFDPRLIDAFISLKEKFKEIALRIKQ